jgi:Superfamily I DNA and RNA helicases
LTLRRNFDEVRETEPAEADAVQLITAHKAKGSEWDTVIVPFLAREARLGGNIRIRSSLPASNRSSRSTEAIAQIWKKKLKRSSGRKWNACFT